MRELFRRAANGDRYGVSQVQSRTAGRFFAVAAGHADGGGEHEVVRELSAESGEFQYRVESKGESSSGWRGSELSRRHPVTGARDAIADIATAHAAYRYPSSEFESCVPRISLGRAPLAVPEIASLGWGMRCWAGAQGRGGDARCEPATGYGLIEGPVGTRPRVSRARRSGRRHLSVRSTDRVSLGVPKRRGIGGMALHADGGLIAEGREIVHVASPSPA